MIKKPVFHTVSSKHQTFILNIDKNMRLNNFDSLYIMAIHEVIQRK
jgi:hypothetical protein